MDREIIRRWQDNEFVLGVRKLLTNFSKDRSFYGPLDLKGIIVGLEGEIEGILPLHGFGTLSLHDIDMSCARLSCSLGGGKYDRLIFKESFFDTCDFSESIFVECDFKFGVFYCASFDDACFTNCCFDRSKWSAPALSGYGGRRASFRECSFAQSHFELLHFRATLFENCSFADVVFRDCDLRGVKFKSCDIQTVEFIDCNCDGMIQDGKPVDG